jgi:VCBS repeat-containing protein
MDRHNRISQSIFTCLLTAVMGTAGAHEVWLCAGTTTVTMPDTGEIVTMWGFAEDDALADLSDGCGNAVQVPGPRIIVPAGDPTLTIHLLNQLTEPVSIVIPGQVTAMMPVRNLDGRVRSFTHETPAGAQRNYAWSALTPGSYVYHSGTHPAVQVQMGLYGAMSNDSALGEAYAGVPYDNEVVMFYGEIDPAMHTAVAGGTYGPGPITNTTSTIDYKPRYFLVNGMPATSTTAPIAAGGASQRTLLRFFNMGLKSHAPMLQGMHMSVVAEDGKPYPFAREQYSLMLAAGATADAIITPATAGTYPLYDRTLALTNGANISGGLMSMLSVGGVVTPPPPAMDTVTILRASYDTAITQLSVWATTTDSLATLNIVDPNGVADVAMTYTPDGSVLNGGYFSGVVSGVTAAPVDVTVNSSSGGTDTNAVPSTEPPVANADSYGVDEDTVLSIPVSGVLGNDLSGGWVLGTEIMEAAVATPPANGTVTLALDGSFTYTPNANFNGADSFTYTATMMDITTSMVLDTSVPGTVDIAVASLNDLPIAQDNAYVMDQNTTLTVAAPGVLANDSDVDSDPITAVLVSGPASGTLSFSANGAFTYTPNTNLTGVDSFSYAANDGKGNGNTAIVNITVNAAANQPPVAVDDAAATRQNTAVGINVLANDTDPDANINPATVTIVTQPNKGGTVSVDPVTGAVTYTPRLNFRGTENFRYRVRDTAGALSNRATVRVNVTR